MTPTDPRVERLKALHVDCIYAAMTLEREQGASAGFDETHPAWVAATKADDAFFAALSEVLGERAREPVAKIKPSQKSMRELLSEVALGDSQPAVDLEELWRKLPTASTALIERKAMAMKFARLALLALPQRAEPASVQALRKLVDRNLTYLGEGGNQWSSITRAEIEEARAALAAHHSTDQNHSG